MYPQERGCQRSRTGRVLALDVASRLRWSLSPDRKGDASGNSTSTTDAYTPDLWTFTVLGAIDPESPDSISGSETTVEEEGDEIVTTTMTWHLERSGTP